MRRLIGVAVALLSLVIVAAVTPASAAGDDEFAFVTLKNRLFQCERQLADLSAASDLPAATRIARVNRLQGEIADLKKRLAGHFDPADVAMGGAIDAIQKYGYAWALNILTHGKFTGRKQERHRPLEALDIPSKNPNFAGKAALPFQGYALMVILSYDPVCREAYSRFIPECEKIVRAMEAKSGKPCDFFNPVIAPNHVGYDVDRFWAMTQQIAGETVRKYFWNHSAEEIHRATNFVSLVMLASLFANVTIDPIADPKEQSRIAFWRANAGPWFVPDLSDKCHKFDICHMFTHAWLVYLKMLNETTYLDGKVVGPTARHQPTAHDLRNAFLFSNVAGVGYECISTVAGTKHGFLELSDTRLLPKPLKKVAQSLGIKKVVGFESIRDIKDNREGAYLGAALFLSNEPVQLSDKESHRRLVKDWLAAQKGGGSVADLDALAAPEQAMPDATGNGLISVADMNAPEGKKRLENGFFAEVYRGMGGFSPQAQAAAELDAFRMLIGTDIMSYNVRILYQSFLDHGLKPVNAWKRARLRHAEIIRAHFAENGKRREIWRDLFSNDGKGTDDDGYNHEADYIYTTRKADIAGCYGPVVLTIRERQPRGLDLNKIAAGYKYYGFKQFIKKAVHGKWKTLIGDYILDEDEYLIPSYVPAQEVVGVVVRAPTKLLTKANVEAANKDFGIAWKAPPVQRRYEKRMVNGYMVIDVYDRKDRFMHRFSENLAQTPVEDSVPTSEESVPTAVTASWQAHLATLTK